MKIPDICPVLPWTRASRPQPTPQCWSAICWVLAVPSQQLRSWLMAHKAHFRPGLVIVNAAKGLETGSLATCSAVAAEALAELEPKYAVLSGPSFAAEVLQGLPTAVVLAAREEGLGRDLREIFSSATFRCYSSTDVIGVEMGGALKNVMAIAAGVSDGLNLGHNSRAALITRGLAEMSRLGVACGRFGAYLHGPIRGWGISP